MTDALCTQIDVDLFFTEPGDRRTHEAKQACRTCPVRTQCLQWSLGFDDIDDQYGIFGGTDPAERRKLRQQCGS